jgi:predicted transposase/invertase (TIGR01784 family)
MSLDTEFTHEDEVKLAREDGMEAGMEKGKLEIARNMLRRGFRSEDVRDITGLSQEVINGLQCGAIQ